MEILTYNPHDSSLIGQQQQNQQYRQTIRTLKVLGAVQIGLGLVLAILSIVYRPSLKTMPVCGCCFWYVITGSLPLFIKNKLDSNFKCKKISFMVCSILGAAIFSPVIILVSCIIMLFSGIDGHGGNIYYEIYIPIVVLSLAVFVVTIISASYCCCCSPFDIRNQQQAVVYVNPSQPANSAIPICYPIAEANKQSVMITTEGTNCQPTLYPKSPQYEVVCGTNLATENPLNHKSYINPPPYKEYE
ncbi:uncharacterized protein LOC134720821 [Mytilus trossulus]|uniref:uncharacterized protein LOC134720821 n=1 Tax=Mytilus trossulus TaxID=6551 RepID=UPI0030046430